jgi:hypothetical protein
MTVQPVQGLLLLFARAWGEVEKVCTVCTVRTATWCDARARRVVRFERPGRERWAVSFPAPLAAPSCRHRSTRYPEMLAPTSLLTLLSFACIEVITTI